MGWESGEDYGGQEKRGYKGMDYVSRIRTSSLIPKRFA